MVPLWILIFTCALHASFLVWVVQSIRLGRMVRINPTGLTRAEHPFRFWFHILMNVVVPTVVSGIFYYIACRDGVSW